MLTTKVTVFILCCLLTSSYGQQPSTCPNQGDGNYGCFDITSQGSCTEVSNQPPSRDLRWPRSGIDLNLDWAIKCGDIIAYKLQWFSGGWSDCSTVYGAAREVATAGINETLRSGTYQQ
ncbi:unnamed protein product [Rotaria sp. Silwood2]|nr:unnamed protein product [Rotaria sp. Silwood2]